MDAFDPQSFVSRRAVARAPGDRELLIEMGYGRRDLIALGRGDPDLPTPAHIVEAAKRALDMGATHYTHWQGREDLRDAIAERYHREFGMTVDASRVAVTAGAQEAIYVAFQSLLNEGDEVLIGDPIYNCYPPAIMLAGGVPVRVPLVEAHNFVMDPAEVEALITPRTKVLVVISPDNPTGAVIPSETMEALASIAVRYNLVVIADDVYDRFVFGGYRHASLATLPQMAERTIFVNGFSKTYSMTGWRVGFLIAPRTLLKAMQVVKWTLDICASAVSQAGALAALTGPQECVAEFWHVYSERHRTLQKGFVALGLESSWSRGALHIYVNITPTGLSAYDFCARALNETGVQMFPGSAFGTGEGYVRATILQPIEKLKVALERLTRWFAQGGGHVSVEK